MKQFNLPDLGEGLPDAEIVRWLVKEGDEVTVDQPMVEMETAKAVVEVPSPFAGRISKLHGKEGDVIDVGAVLVSFGEVGEVAEEAPEPAPVAETTKEEAQPQSSAPAAGSDTFLLPDLGEGLPDAEIVRWLVKEGDTVTVDQPMVEMETAKAVVEVPSPFAGKVSKLYGQAGDVIEVGAPLVEFGGTGGSSGGESKAAAPAKQEAGEEKRADSGTVVGAVEVGNHVVAETANAVIKALAKKLKVDLTKVKGTGKDGAITQKDVREAAKSGATASTTTAEQPQQTAGVDTSNPLAYKASPAVRALADRKSVV